MKEEPVLIIREAGAEDAGAVEALYRSFVSSPDIRVLPQRLEAIASDPRNFLLVGELGGVVCCTGFLTICLDPMFGNQPYAVLENVVVEEALRGEGIGSRLFLEVEELCRQRDCSKIMLLSSSSREQAHRFFERQGYDAANKRGFVKYRRQFRNSPR